MSHSPDKNARLFRAASELAEYVRPNRTKHITEVRLIEAVDAILVAPSHELPPRITVAETIDRLNAESDDLEAGCHWHADYQLCSTCLPEGVCIRVQHDIELKKLNAARSTAAVPQVSPGAALDHGPAAARGTNGAMIDPLVGPTPRTDAFLKGDPGGIKGIWVINDFARQLERELAECERKLDLAADAYGEAHGRAAEMADSIRSGASSIRETGPYRVGEPEDEDDSATVLNANGETMAADVIVGALNRIATPDVQRLDFLAEITNLNALMEYGAKLSAEKMAAFDAAAEVLAVRYEFHRRTNDTPTAFRLAVDDSMRSRTDGGKAS